MNHIRLSFYGSSGTGKTTLAEFASTHLGVPMCPIGARSVSQAMGFASPYDVDKVGKRAEFQKRLISEKAEWEAKHDDFVTDRTVFDNLAYLVLHDVRSIDEQLLIDVTAAGQRYTQVMCCPIYVFCDPGGDPQRVQDVAYQTVFETVVVALVKRYTVSWKTVYDTVTVEGVEARKRWLTSFLVGYAVDRKVSDR